MVAKPHDIREDIKLNQNQLLDARLENVDLSTIDQNSKGEGTIIYDTEAKLPAFKDDVSFKYLTVRIELPSGTFKGIATTTTNPGTPTSDEWWTAQQTGVYTHFDGVEVDTITNVYNWLVWDNATTSWSVQQVPVGMMETDPVFTQSPAAQITNQNIIDWSLDTSKEDISFEFCDIEAGTEQTYTLDIKAQFDYEINAAVLETDDGTLVDVHVIIDSTDVTGLALIEVGTTATETTATADNLVEAGSRVYIKTTTSYTGTPTILRGKLKTTRV